MRTNRARPTTSDGGSFFSASRARSAAAAASPSTSATRARWAVAAASSLSGKGGGQRLAGGGDPAGHRLQAAQHGDLAARAQVGLVAQRAAQVAIGDHRADGGGEPRRAFGRHVGQLRGGHEPVRGLPPALALEVGAAARGELGGELGVRPDGGGDPVLQRDIAVELRGRGAVQRMTAGGREVGVDGGPDQLVGEDDVVAGVAERLGEQARLDGLVQAAEGIGHRGEGDRVGERAAGAEHGRGQHEALRPTARAWRRAPARARRTSGARAGSGTCRPAPRGTARPAVTGRAGGGRRCGRAGAVRRRGRARRARRLGQLDDLLGLQAREWQVLVADALPARREVVAGAQHDEDLVAPEPSDDEDEGAGGGVVHPLCVVEHEHDGARALQLAEHGQQLGADGQRVGVGRRGAVAGEVGEELADHAVREPGLGFVAAGPEHADVGAVGQEAVDERGLADARGAAQPEHPRPARAGVFEFGRSSRRARAPVRRRSHSTRAQFGRANGLAAATRRVISRRAVTRRRRPAAPRASQGSTGMENALISNMSSTMLESCRAPRSSPHTASWSRRSMR